MSFRKSQGQAAAGKDRLIYETMRIQDREARRGPTGVDFKGPRLGRKPRTYAKKAEANPTLKD